MLRCIIVARPLVHDSSSEIDPIYHHHPFSGNGWGAERSLHGRQRVNTTTIIMIYITVNLLLANDRRDATITTTMTANDHSTRAM